MQQFAKISFPVDVGLPDEDPWSRPPYAPPFLHKAVLGNAPIRDVRDEVLPNHNPAPIDHAREFLRIHGFTTIESPTTLDTADVDDIAVLENMYYPECIELVKKVTGAKHGFPALSVSRKGVEGKGLMAFNDRKDFSVVSNAEKKQNSHSAQSKPAGVMHVDFSPRGARSAIRCWKDEIYDACKEAGIIDREDQLGDAKSKESAVSIEEGYNRGERGPRYAIFSVWRPLAKVTRDPLGIAQSLEGENIVQHRFENRLIGSPTLGGDYLGELIMWRVKDGVENPVGPEFLYVKEQTPEEVTIVKLFDSASLGNTGDPTKENNLESSGRPHASLDLGDAGYGDQRYSIEVRVFAIW